MIPGKGFRTRAGGWLRGWGRYARGGRGGGGRWPANGQRIAAAPSLCRSRLANGNGEISRGPPRPARTGCHADEPESAAPQDTLDTPAPAWRGGLWRGRAAGWLAGQAGSHPRSWQPNCLNPGVTPPRPAAAAPRPAGPAPPRSALTTAAAPCPCIRGGPWKQIRHFVIPGRNGAGRGWPRVEGLG